MCDVLLVQANTLKGLISKNQDIVSRWTNAVTISEIKLTLADLETQRQEVLQIYRSVSDISTADELKVHEPLFQLLFNAVRKMQIDAGELLIVKEAAAKASVSPSFKLERIKLPTFSGVVSEWQSFRDLFKSSVDKNPSISGAEKLIHLKSCLIGEAAGIVSSFEATDANYPLAWNLVVKRYSNKREIIFAHIRKIDELQVMSEESAVGIRVVTDTINECVRSLKTLGVPVDHWDLILVYMAHKKLSKETRKQWLLEDKTAIPTLDKFIEYLETRARALADSEDTSKLRKTSSHNQRKSTSHVTSFKSTCPKCAEPHHLYKCKSFVESTPNQRKELVQKKQLCFNCLFPGHSVSKCKMELSCRVCGNRHHTLLHIQSADPGTSSVATGVGNSSPVKTTSVTATRYASEEDNQDLVLMGTLMASVSDSLGVKKMCRVFVDPGQNLILSPSSVSTGSGSSGGKRVSALMVLVGPMEELPPVLSS